MCRVCYGPSLPCAEFAMCRVVPKSFERVTSNNSDSDSVTWVLMSPGYAKRQLKS